MKGNSRVSCSLMVMFASSLAFAQPSPATRSGDAAPEQAARNVQVKFAREAPVSCPYCDMTGADLRGRNLTDANLTGARLTGANFEGATLDGIQLIGAQCDGANFNRAKLNPSQLGDANLSR